MSEYNAGALIAAVRLGEAVAVDLLKDGSFYVYCGGQPTIVDEDAMMAIDGEVARLGMTYRATERAATYIDFWIRGKSQRADHVIIVRPAGDRARDRQRSDRRSPPR